MNGETQAGEPRNGADYQPVEASAQRDTVWIPSVPYPLMGWRTDTCACGARFRGRNRRDRYELHYRREHQRDDMNPDSYSLMEVSRDEAERIYERVNADHPVTTPETPQP